MIAHLIRWFFYAAVYSNGKLAFLLWGLQKLFPVYEAFLIFILTLAHIMYPAVKRSHREPLYSWIMRCNRAYAVTFVFVISESNHMSGHKLMMAYGSIDFSKKRVRGALREVYARHRSFEKAERVLTEHRKRYVLHF